MFQDHGVHLFLFTFHANVAKPSIHGTKAPSCGWSSYIEEVKGVGVLVADTVAPLPVNEVMDPVEPLLAF